MTRTEKRFTLDIHEIELQERGIMPSGEEMRKRRPVSEFPTLYMDQRALAFIRAWPDVPDTLRPAYSRFYDAGLIWSDPNAPQGMEWPGSLRLTATGHRIREVMIGKHINFFRLVDVFGLVSTESLATRSKATDFFLKLWNIYEGAKDRPTPLTWDNPDMKRYVSLRLQGIDPAVALAEKGIKQALADLRKAMERLEFHTRMAAWRAAPDDNDIPF